MYILNFDWKKKKITIALTKERLTGLALSVTIYIIYIHVLVIFLVF